MMPSYHIGTLDATSKKTLAEDDSTAEATSEPRAAFLQSKVWTKARLTGKTAVSSDTKVFTFTLEHEAQRLGLPTGQHLMMRLRDPATREAIIRAYTPLTDDGSPETGKLDVLVKIYRAAGERPGGLMTQALDSIPLGHWVEFKGPVGKYEYLGAGRFAVGGGVVRHIRRFVMVCAGSGVTPIFAVLRAVMRDEADTTRCLVLDGNRSEADILCRAEMDVLAAGGKGDRCRIIHTLSGPGEGWAGRRGMMDAKLYEEEAGPPGEARDEMVLVCGPPGMVKAVRENFMRMGWGEEDFAIF